MRSNVFFCRIDVARLKCTNCTLKYRQTLVCVQIYVKVTYLNIKVDRKSLGFPTVFLYVNVLSPITNSLSIDNIKRTHANWKSWIRITLSSSAQITFATTDVYFSRTGQTRVKVWMSPGRTHETSFRRGISSVGTTVYRRTSNWTSI